VTLSVTDDGSGFPADAAGRLRDRGGLAGIRERIGALGGDFDMGNVEGEGARLCVAVPHQERGPGA
jgi:signal transduction histidine kinase